MKAQSNHRSFHLFLAATVAGAALLGGCGYLRQAREDVRPTAVPAVQLAQTLNPEAGKNRKVVAGLDGAVAKNVDAAYVKSFETQKGSTRAVDTFVGLSGLSSQ